MAEEKPAEVVDTAAAPATDTATAAPAETPVVDAASDAHAEPTLLESFIADVKDGDTKDEKPADVPEGGDQVVEAKTDEKVDEKTDKPEDKPAEKPEETKDAKPEEKPAEKPAEAAKPEPVDYKYTLPEHIKMDDALKGSFHSALDEFRANPAEGAQKLIDLYNDQMTKYAEHLQREQHRVFGETRKTWSDQIKADPILGGAGHKTAMKAIARMRDQFASRHKPGTDEYNADIKSFDTMLRITGSGDHPALMHFIHNVAKFADEPSVRHGDINPPPDIGKGGKAGAKIMYDHPRSSQNRK